MRLRRGSVASVMVLMALAFMAGGCSGKHKLVPGAPDWVNRGSGAFKDHGARAFYGVGAVTGIASPSLAMQTADQRARADIGRQLDTFVNGLFRDYQSSTAALPGKPPVEDQYVEDSLRNLTRISVHGARVIDRWRDPKTDTLYALAFLELEGIKATVEEMRDMDQALRSHIRSRAENAFDDIRLEEGRK